MTKKVIIDSPHFRQGTETEMKEFVFNFLPKGAKNCALGDSICWLSSIKYIAEKYNYLFGHLIVSPYFKEIAMNVMGQYPHWRIHTNVPDRLDGYPMCDMPWNRIPNATTTSLTDLGFLYFVGITPTPEEYKNHVQLDLRDVKMPGELVSPYAVMTPGASAPTRMLPADVYNKICDHLISKGIAPVHLGVTSMGDGKRPIHMNEGYDFSKGVNLIGHTTLLEAALIMKNAEMVIGIDNGLLHLAGMTDATILQGFTMVGPNHRRIFRPHGQTYELFADKEKLKCLFCQENVRFFVNHSFETCLYKEEVPMCVKELNIESWAATIDLSIHKGKRWPGRTQLKMNKS